MTIFRKLKNRRFAAATSFLVALGLVMSVLLFVGNAHAADGSVQQVSVHHDMDDDIDTGFHHVDGMSSCFSDCEWPESRQIVIAMPTIMSLEKWIPVVIVPAHTFLSPPRRPPQA